MISLYLIRNYPDWLFCPVLCFKGNVCRNSDRAGPVKLFWVEAEETLLQTRVEIHISIPTRPFHWLIEMHFCHLKTVKCSVVCVFLRLRHHIWKANWFSVVRFIFLHYFLVCSVWTKWSSTLSQSGWQTSGRINCQAFWEVLAPCTRSSSCVSSYCMSRLQTYCCTQLSD